MPLQENRAAIFRWLLKALVDVLHQQVHTIPIQRLHPFLNVTAFEGSEHLHHQTFCTILKQSSRYINRIIVIIIIIITVIIYKLLHKNDK